jgi:ABC-type phosphate transport system substrate-binding protein
MRFTFRSIAGLGLMLALVGSTKAPQGRAAAGAPAYALVVRKDVDVQNLRFSDVRRLFRMRQRFWRPGRPVVLMLPPPGSVARQFLLEHVLDLDEPGLMSLIAEKSERDSAGRAPRIVATDAATIAAVRSTPGAIGIVSAAVANLPDLRRLRIDGRSPGQPGYALNP